jgi:EAL domain-containing protein (putative c-di-GMP-specific phosphodiesterase class I)
MASIGISCYPRDGGLTKTLIKKADIAMYKAKESGKNQYRYYDKPLEKAYRRARNLMRDLTDALEYDQFFLVYQPQFDLRQKRFSGAEVLIRWQHPKQGLISPDEFIPLAEMNGMINPITERILIEVASNFTALKSAGRDDFTLSVNISPRTLFDREFVPNLTFLLEHYPLPPGRLRLELTENTFMKNMDELARKLTELSALGIHLEIDDFGTGFTSLNYLTNLPINSLKIDRSYIIALHQNDKNRAISQAVITLGHQLGQEIIAEGAESKEEVNTLRTLGADKIQGYYYSKPLRFAALLETLQTQ